MALSTGQIAGIAVGASIFFIICHIPICLYFYRFVRYLIRRYKAVELPELTELEKGAITLTPVQPKVPSLVGIKIKKKIGEGGFGEVYLGIWNDTKVALKKIKGDMEQFTREAGTLFNVIHPNCVQFLGVWKDKTTEQNYIVLEYLSQGNVLQLLRTKDIQINQIFQMAISASKGMQYLESKKIVHSDLACRNLLVSTLDGRFNLKVCDFGLSHHEEKADKSAAVKLPIRWCAPELFNGSKPTIKGDIWSFAVCLWEMFSFGGIPYKELKLTEIIDHVNKGNRLDKPEMCPGALYALMLKCWNQNPYHRPNFAQITRELKQIAKEHKTDTTSRSSSNNNLASLSSVENSGSVHSKDSDEPAEDNYVLTPVAEGTKVDHEYVSMSRIASMEEEDKDIYLFVDGE